MTPDDFERLRSWTLDITVELLPGAKFRDEGSERKFLGQGGLHINRGSGAWYSHAAGKGGRSPIGLIMFLSDLNHPAAIGWAETFLASHPGEGTTGSAEDPEHPGSRGEAHEIAARLADLAGTPAEAYLRGRGLSGPFPDCVAYLPHARLGEHAIVGKLAADGRIVGFQLGYLDPDGRKSVVEPVRRRFMLERCPEAAFEVPGSGGIIVAEGLEDLLSVAALGRPERLIGVPGTASLGHLKVPNGTPIITVLRDGDEPGSPADAALWRGVDALLLQKVDVDVTPTPPGQDANSTLQAGGPSALAELIDSAAPAVLSRDGVLRWAAGLDDLTYEEQRLQIARRVSIRVGKLDEAVHRLRLEQSITRTPELEAPPAGLLDEDVDLAEALDSVHGELRRYIVAPDTLLATAALWSAHTHLVHHQKVRITVSPRLAIQARDAGCGKTIALEALAALVAKPRLASSVTASSVLRVIDAIRPTFLVDEADQLLCHGHAKPDLVAVLNASHRRVTAYVERSVPASDGSWMVERFCVWGAMALASIGELPRTQQDRSIVLHLHKALAKDVKEHLEDGTSAQLQLLQRKLATWASYLDELPRPEMPEILTRQAGRVADNWRPLLAIADLAGGQWPQLARQAVEKAVSAEKRPSRIQRLLASIGNAFEKKGDGLDPNTGKLAVTGPFEKLETSALVDFLISDPEEEWATANRGRPINAYWLRDNLRDLLDPPGSQRWDVEDKNSGVERPRASGYLRTQFDRAFAAYLTEYTPPDPPKPSGSSGSSGSSRSDAASSPEKSMAYDDGPGDHDETPTNPSRSNSGSRQTIEDAQDSPCGDHDDPDDPDDHDTEGGGQGVYVSGAGSEDLPPNVEAWAKQLAAKHPNWSLKRIAREMRQPERRIAQYLPDHNQPKRTKRANGGADSEVDRVVEILRALGTDGATASSLYHSHHVYLGTLKEAAARGLLQERGGRWSVQ